MEENVKTSVKIAGRVYPLFVHKDEMTRVKDLEQLINNTYSGIQIDYAINDKFDCLAMTLLSILSQSNQQNVTSDEVEISGLIDQIDVSLKKALQN
jgi:hypothetical protein